MSRRVLPWGEKTVTGMSQPLFPSAIGTQLRRGTLLTASTVSQNQRYDRFAVLRYAKLVYALALVGLSFSDFGCVCKGGGGQSWVGSPEGLYERRCGR